MHFHIVILKGAAGSEGRLALTAIILTWGSITTSNTRLLLS